MKPNTPAQDRQQILIDLYTQYLLGKITLGQLLMHLRKMYWESPKNNMPNWWVSADARSPISSRIKVNSRSRC